MNNKKKENNLSIEDLYLIYGGIMIVILIAFLKQYWQQLLPSKVGKQQLVKYYQVDKKTLNKWVYFFCSDIVNDYEDYLKKRKLNRALYNDIIDHLGKVNDHPIMTKKEIVKMAEGTYRSLRESIQKHPDDFGVTVEAFTSLSKFPPIICKQILAHY